MEEFWSKPLYGARVINIIINLGYPVSDWRKFWKRLHEKKMEPFEEALMKEYLKQAVCSGRLGPMTKNYGKKTDALVRQWLNL